MTTKKIFVFFSALAAFAFTSCNETDETDKQWRDANLAAYEAIKTAEGWHLLDTGDGPEGVYYKDITAPETVTGNEYPLQTASVKINYTGKYYTDQVFDSGKSATFNVNTLVRGFAMALQYMHTGQTWEVCIPYYLGYGVSTSTSMQGYTTLFFEIELLEINQYP
jgi:FKBP-type peptidyl-prolyl cis-trans isomerase